MELPCKRRRQQRLLTLITAISCILRVTDITSRLRVQLPVATSSPAPCALLTYCGVAQPPAEVFSSIVTVESDGDDVAVGLDEPWRLISAERSELSPSCLDLTHTHTHTHSARGGVCDGTRVCVGPTWTWS